MFPLLAATSITFLSVGVFTSWLLVLQIDVPEEPKKDPPVEEVSSGTLR